MIWSILLSSANETLSLPLISASLPGKTAARPLNLSNLSQANLYYYRFSSAACVPVIDLSLSVSPSIPKTLSPSWDTLICAFVLDFTHYAASNLPTFVERAAGRDSYFGKASPDRTASRRSVRGKWFWADPAGEEGGTAKTPPANQPKKGAFDCRDQI